ncbi:unnamed protein product [Bursaphelenchus xylophilus]|nr:unnamed protein product [Bursaphelenchus xylophilus]CAG9116983.1 unnamed protein product [Bursaphelenchus xylophilus]
MARSHDATWSSKLIEWVLSNKQLVLFRVVTFVWLRTWFVPDEYFQSIEISYGQVFGKGETTWEWDPNNALRSYLHPLLYMSPYYILKLLKIDSGVLIRAIPVVIHFLFTLISDFAIQKAYRKLLKYADAEKNALILYQLNWFILYSLPRSLANTIEMLLGIYAAGFYPKRSFIPLVLLAGLIRPTSAIIWAPLVLYQLYLGGFRILKYFLTVSLSLLTISTFVDYLFYGRFTFPVLNFFLFNIYQGGSAQFGVNSAFYYIAGLYSLAPIEMTVLSLIVLTSIRQVHQHVKWMISHEPQIVIYAILSLSYIIVHSLIPHKEHRFLLPVIPFIIPVVSSIYSRLRPGSSLLIIALINIPLFMFFGGLHQIGHLSVVNELRNGIKATNGGIISYLTPCYSIPQYAYLHPDGLKWTITQLDCISVVREGDRDTTPQDIFFQNTTAAISSHWNKYVGDAKYIVMYDKLLSELDQTSIGSKLRTLYNIKSYFHTIFPVGENSGKYLVLLTKKN